MIPPRWDRRSDGRRRVTIRPFCLSLASRSTASIAAGGLGESPLSTMNFTDPGEKPTPCAMRLMTAAIQVVLVMLLGSLALLVVNVIAVVEPSIFLTVTVVLLIDFSWRNCWMAKRA